MHTESQSSGGHSAGLRVRKALTSAGSFLMVILLTYLGLLAVTFFIGRVMPIDPVLAIVGDRAPEQADVRSAPQLAGEERPAGLDQGTGG